MQNLNSIIAVQNHHRTKLATGDGSLIGMTVDGDAYIELVQDDYLIQYHLDKRGQIVQQAHEARGDELLLIARNIKIPETPQMLAHLNWDHGRKRGMRMDEDVQARVQTIPLAHKLAILPTLPIPISPMMLFGIDESYIHSAVMISPQNYIICRRLRLIYALPEVQYDAQLLPYDYDSIEIHRLQVYDAIADEIFPDNYSSIDLDSTLNRPLDCMRDAENLYLFDGGNEEQHAQWHIWTLA